MAAGEGGAYKQEDKGTCTCTQSVKENMSRFTERQIKAAVRAKELYIALGRQRPLDHIRKTIKANTIQTNPVTFEDVQLAEEFFGTDVGSLNGMTTCKKAKNTRQELSCFRSNQKGCHGHLRATVPHDCV